MSTSNPHSDLSRSPEEVRGAIVQFMRRYPNHWVKQHILITEVANWCDVTDEEVEAAYDALITEGTLVEAPLVPLNWWQTILSKGIVNVWVKSA